MTIFPPDTSSAEVLNHTPGLVSTDVPRLHAAVRKHSEQIYDLLRDRPGLFANDAMFLARSDFEAMQTLVRAVETVAALPAYQDAVGAAGSRDAGFARNTRGAFMGYDFHLTPDGPRLIEINTNAGGAFLNAMAQTALQACCPEIERILDQGNLPDFEAFVVEMMSREWRATGREGLLQTLAIVDGRPESQFLYPEFLLAQRVFAAHGIKAFVVEPADLELRANGLFFGEQRIDLVYNRLVDFDLTDDNNQAIREAWERNDIVLTPNPHHHRLFANKTNLVMLSDPEFWDLLGLGDETRRALSLIPETRRLTPENAADYWKRRKGFFFKPASGYASKAVWRGEKLTQGTWQGLSNGEYVAQAFVPPSTRMIDVDGTPINMKTDIRLYTYAGETFLAAARLYQGQTTNFRTPGGGFAPVFIV